MSRRAGFSLIELMTTILIMGIIAGFSIPAIAKALSGWNLHTSREQIISEFKLAREKAVAQGSPLGIWCSPGSSSYFINRNPPGGAWIPYTLPNRVTFYSVSFTPGLPYATYLMPDGRSCSVASGAGGLPKSGTIVLANNRGAKDTVVVNMNGWVGQP
jgi:prepilin-type N-terminal cleavage/methylation domain-containing protein